MRKQTLILIITRAEKNKSGFPDVAARLIWELQGPKARECCRWSCSNSVLLFHNAAGPYQ